MKDAERKALLDLLLDSDSLERLSKWSNNTNIFEILKTTNQEIRHSNVLAWLMDPNENHRLGDAFLKAFVAVAVSAYTEQKPELIGFDSFGILLQNFYSYRVMREANHMDLLLYSESEKTVIVIENKIWAGETGNQLVNYRNRIESEYSDFSKLFLFLTPQGDEPSDSNWVVISYRDVLEILDKIILGNTQSDDVNLIIRDYADIIRRKIIMEKDPELKKLCAEIYSKHRTALRLIYENVQVDNSADSSVITSVLNEYDKDGKLIHDGESSWSFFTKEMNAFLPPLSEEKSSWGTKWIYYYWFSTDNAKIHIHFELGGWGLDDVRKKNETAIINVCNKKADDFRYKRLYLKSEKLPDSGDEQYEAKLEKSVRNLIDAAIANEKVLLEKANSLIAKTDK